MRVNAYAAPAAGQPLAPTTIERRDVGPNDVLIEIEYAGICHSDIHTVNGDWGPQPFPVVPGPRDRRHRRRGRLRRHHATGSATASASAAWSTPAASAPTAATATSSTASTAWSAPTPAPTATAPPPRAATPPTSSSTPTTSSRVPDGIDPAAAAPLLCAGITTYSPLRHWGAGPGKKVAVVGLGGLGHMAVKIAHALGAEVTVLSQSLKKQEDGLRLGADHYFATSDPDTFEQLAGRFDLIVNTVSAAIDLDAYLGLLAVDGTLVNVGAPAEPLSVNVFSLIGAPARPSPAR